MALGAYASRDPNNLLSDVDRMNRTALGPLYAPRDPTIAGVGAGAGPPAMPLQFYRWGANNEMLGVNVQHRLVAPTYGEVEVPKFGIDPQGQAYIESSYKPDRTQLMRAIDDWFSPFGEGVYVRSTDNPRDHAYLDAGSHQGSINHVTGVPEYGLSVAPTQEFPAKYTYLVQGARTGTGTDGEPILDARTARPITAPMSEQQFNKLAEQAEAQRKAELGLSEEAYRALMSGASVR